MITKKLIREGIDDGIIIFEKSPDGGEVVCRIGEDWFYFNGTWDCDSDGRSVAVYDPVAYVKNHSKKYIVDDIYDTLDYFRLEDDLKDVYGYCEWILRERTNPRAIDKNYAEVMERHT